MAEIENLKIYGGATYTVGNQDIIANEWEAGKTYVKNKSYVIREHRLYVCNVTHTSVEPFDATKWTEITIGDAIAANTTAIGDLSQLTTSVTSSLVGAVNEVDAKADNFIYTDSTVTDFITLFASIPNNKTVGFLMNSGTVSNCPVPYPTGVIAKWNSNTAYIQLTQLNGTDASYIGRIISGVLSWRKITTTA